MKLRESVQPSMGWKRALIYWRHRMFRTGDSTYRITAGLASGVAVSFSPILGTHLAQGFLLSWLVRGNFLAMFVGTAFGNPSTLPFLFWIDYKIGINLFDLFGNAEAVALPQDYTWAIILHEPMKLLLPLLAGSIISGLISWPVSYLLLCWPVRMMRTVYVRRYLQGREPGDIS
jgi:uncharacterized protein (DUF2062 family)